MVIGKQKNFVDFVDSGFSLFKNFIVRFEQIVRAKPLRYVLVIYVVFIVFPCFSYAFSEPSGQYGFKSSNNPLLLTEIQNKGFSDVGFFVKSSRVEVENHPNFIKWLSEISGRLDEEFLCFYGFIEQVCGISGEQYAQGSYHYNLRSALIGLVIGFFIYWFVSRFNSLFTGSRARA